MSTSDQDLLVGGDLDIATLSDAQLRARLQEAGIFCGPITSSTRTLYEEKLLKSQSGELTMTVPRVPDVLPSTPESTYDDVVEIPTPEDDSKADVFYGLLVPSGCCKLNDIRSVYTRKEAVVEAARKIKGARFKAFPARNEAEIYSNGKDDTLSDTARGEPATLTDNNFSAPKPQDLSILRGMIEKGDIETFRTSVWSNPRYIVSSGDTPVALQIGCKWNALHVAAKSNQIAVAESLVEALKADEFWRLLYPSDSEETREQRKRFLTDLYLNSPDSGSCETPLHFAAKFGHVEMVEFLLMQQGIDVSACNKYGETAASIAGQRCNANKSRIETEIQTMLEEQVYVPMFRSEGNVTPPIVGKLWSPDPVHSPVLIATRQANLLSGPPLTSHECEQRCCNEANVVDSSFNVSAFAGPMSPSRAAQFRREWRSPLGSPPHSGYRKQVVSIRRGDSERGLERIGRDLAHREGLKWSEYWDFLGCYVDLSTSAGLDVLEKYFSDRSSKQTDREEQNNIKNLVAGASRLQIEEDPVFLLGPEPTKLDQDVLLAVNAATLDEHRHKLVKKWQDLVLSCPQELDNTKKEE
ncbi:ankyrin repeat and LEM domain-containing protein 2-like isoform X2 [Corticium candelabrum]|uniref:ankyrin repeat and LEM domain-containing protein 2-like isoform X2 n=1 Tax=Corticium candelabrum TaxID=121492 RepID=UPI002E273202|nr:ankyrin repeat and LEM domain-containing protein 2-like isoform X2 [Corticium candelabrum]